MSLSNGISDRNRLSLRAILFTAAMPDSMLRPVVPVHKPVHLIEESMVAGAVLVGLALSGTLFRRHITTGRTNPFYGKIRV